MEDKLKLSLHMLKMLPEIKAALAEEKMTLDQLAEIITIWASTAAIFESRIDQYEEKLTMLFIANNDTWVN